MKIIKKVLVYVKYEVFCKYPSVEARISGGLNYRTMREKWNRDRIKSTKTQGTSSDLLGVYPRAVVPSLWVTMPLG